MGVLNSFFWSAVDKFSLQLVQFFVGLLIARYVLPEEYGLIAMLNIVLAISQTFVEGGFSNALIQKKCVSEIDYSTAFYFNFVISILFYLVLYASSPWIALFYEEPRLEELLRYLGLGVIFQGLTIVQRAKLAIQLDFKSQAKINFVSGIVSGIVGVIMACKNCGVWALVVHSLLNSLLNVLLLFAHSRWFPNWLFSWHSFKTLFSFGSKILLSQLLHTIYSNLYSLIKKKKYSATDVGFYNRANSFAQLLPLNISTIVGRVVYPMLCKLQGNDEELRKYVEKTIVGISYIVFPLIIWLSILSNPLIVVLLTEKWGAASSLFSILCWGYIWCPLSIINNQLVNSKGHSDYYFIAELLKKTSGILILLLTLPFGVHFLCYGVVVYYILDYLISIHFTKKIISNLGYWVQIRTIAKPLFISIASGALVYLSAWIVDSNILKLLFGSVCGVISYVLLAYLLKIDEFQVLLMRLKKIFKS